MAEKAKRKQKPTGLCNSARSIQRSGRMIVEMKGGKPFYCCDNMEIDREDAERLIRNGWVKPILQAGSLPTHPADDRVAAPVQGVRRPR